MKLIMEEEIYFLEREKQEIKVSKQYLFNTKSIAHIDCNDC